MSLASRVEKRQEELTPVSLNMRTAHGIYRTLQQFIEDADKGGFDEDIDMDFRSVSGPVSKTVGVC